MYRLLAASAVVETANSAALSDYGVNAAAGIAEIVVIFRNDSSLAEMPGSFAYAGPSNWNSLPAYLKDSSLSSFKHHLKTFLFSFY